MNLRGDTVVPSSHSRPVTIRTVEKLLQQCRVPNSVLAKATGRWERTGGHAQMSMQLLVSYSNFHLVKALDSEVQFIGVTLIFILVKV